METARKLKDLDLALNSTTTRKDLPGFLNNPENAQKLNGLVEDIRYALMDYQVCTPTELFVLVVSKILPRLRCNETSTTSAVSRL